MRELSPQIYYGERELLYVPKHFTKCSTPVSDEAVLWINTHLTGRFAFSSLLETTDFFLQNIQLVYFENPAEATLYELRWAG